VKNTTAVVSVIARQIRRLESRQKRAVQIARSIEKKEKHLKVIQDREYDLKKQLVRLRQESRELVQLRTVPAKRANVPKPEMLITLAAKATAILCPKPESTPVHIRDIVAQAQKEASHWDDQMPSRLANTVYASSRNLVPVEKRPFARAGRGMFRITHFGLQRAGRVAMRTVITE